MQTCAFPLHGTNVPCVAHVELACPLHVEEDELQGQYGARVQEAPEALNCQDGIRNETRRK